jgi:hypothetical protein
MLLGTAVGLGLLSARVFQKVPVASELVEVSGPLQSYAVYKLGRSSFKVILTLEGAPHRYWTDAVSRNQAAQVFEGKAHVSLYAEKAPTHPPIDGDAYKSYGLWVDGLAIETPESALHRDATLFHIVFPLMGVGSLGMVFLVGRGWRRTPVNPELRRSGSSVAEHQPLDGRR